MSRRRSGGTRVGISVRRPLRFIGRRKQPRLRRVDKAGLAAMMAADFTAVGRFELHGQFLEKHGDDGGGLVDLIGRKAVMKIDPHCNSAIACWTSSSGR